MQAKMQQKCNGSCSKYLQCIQEVTKRCIQCHLMPSFQMMGQYAYVKCMLPTCVPYDVAKHGCDHHDIVNRIEICQKTRSHAIPPLRFVDEGALVCDVAIRVAEAMIAELLVHTVAKGVELFGQTLVLQMVTFFVSGLVT